MRGADLPLLIARCQLQPRLKWAFEGFCSLSNASGIILAWTLDIQGCIFLKQCAIKEKSPFLLNIKNTKNDTLTVTDTLRVLLCSLKFMILKAVFGCLKTEVLASFRVQWDVPSAPEGCQSPTDVVPMSATPWQVYYVSLGILHDRHLNVDNCR